jgi:hypothetical protein
MRARQRFLKAKSFGATASYDARLISGLSDAAAVSSWADQSGNGHTASQAIAANQPSYRAGVFGGQPSVRFDGSNDQLIHTADNTSECIIFAVAQTRSVQSVYRGICAFGIDSPSGTMLLSMVNSGNWGTYALTANPEPADTGVSTLTPTIFQMVDNGSSGGEFYVNEAAVGTWPTDSLGQAEKHIGGLAAAGQHAHIDLGALWLTPSSSAAYRKRIARGLALSFKIACS